MQKIKKFWHTVQSIILKKSNFGPNLTFWPPWGLGKSFPKGNIYIVGSALLVSNFMQKIKKFWRAVRKQSLKKSNFGPNLTFWPPWGLGKSFPKGNIYIVESVLLVSNFMQKIKKFWRAVRKQSLKKSNFGPNLTFWLRPQEVKSFFRKSENVTFLQLRCSNYVQNIKNFWQADPEISTVPTNRRTDEAEFIGPFRLKPWVQ